MDNYFDSKPPEHRAEMDPELERIERQLQALRPQPEGLDRDRLLYMAGQAAALAKTRSAWGPRLLKAWAATATTVSALLAIVIVGDRWHESGPRSTYPSLSTSPDTASPSPPQTARASASKQTQPASRPVRGGADKPPNTVASAQHDRTSQGMPAQVPDGPPTQRYAHTAWMSSEFDAPFAAWSARFCSHGIDPTQFMAVPEAPRTLIQSEPLPTQRAWLQKLLEEQRNDPLGGRS